MKRKQKPVPPLIPLEVWVWVQDTPWAIMCYRKTATPRDGVAEAIQLSSGIIFWNIDVDARLGENIFSFVPMKGVEILRQLMDMEDSDYVGRLQVRDRRLLLNKLEAMLV
jgi:hypothetical protein